MMLREAIEKEISLLVSKPFYGEVTYHELLLSYQRILKGLGE